MYVRGRFFAIVLTGVAGTALLAGVVAGPHPAASSAGSPAVVADSRPAEPVPAIVDDTKWD